jgi:hypothetical protein
MHFNAAVALTREQHADYFLDTIIEGIVAAAVWLHPESSSPSGVPCAVGRAMSNALRSSRLASGSS